MGWSSSLVLTTNPKFCNNDNYTFYYKINVITPLKDYHSRSVKLHCFCLCFNWKCRLIFHFDTANIRLRKLSCCSLFCVLFLLHTASCFLVWLSGCFQYFLLWLLVCHLTLLLSVTCPSCTCGCTVFSYIISQVFFAA